MAASGTRVRHLRPVESTATKPDADAKRRDDLVALAQAGDTDAWSRLYQELFDGLYRHIGYLTHDPVAAEDLVQEAFARAFSNLDRFDGRSSFETWLHGIGINVVRKHWRTNTRRERAYKRLEEHQELRSGMRRSDPELSHARKQRATALLDALESLPPKLREAYVLMDLRQIPREQAAAQLGITVGNLSVRTARARARIRDELTRLGWMGDEGGPS